MIQTPTHAHAIHLQPSNMKAPRKWRFDIGTGHNLGINGPSKLVSFTIKASTFWEDKTTLQWVCLEIDPICGTFRGENPASHHCYISWYPHNIQSNPMKSHSFTILPNASHVELSQLRPFLPALQTRVAAGRHQVWWGWGAAEGERLGAWTISNDFFSSNLGMMVDA